MFGNWGPLEPESIFGAKIGRMAFYEAHAEELNNLFNDSYWRAKMTPKHKEMRRHPNRSQDWIPNEILKERDELFIQWCDYLLPEGMWNTDYDSMFWRGEEVCLVCGTDEKACAQRLKDEMDDERTLHFTSLTCVWCNFCQPKMRAIIAEKTKHIQIVAPDEKV